MKKLIKLEQRVVVLHGKYAGQFGTLVAKGGGQYDVKMESDGSTRYFGIGDIDPAE